LTDPLTLSQSRQAFPILGESANGHPLVYFDNAATTQKPRSVITAIERYYRHQNANVHRGSHHLSTVATVAFEEARSLVRGFINATHNHEIIWTKGTTESINLIAQSYGRSTLSPGDEILISLMEHHANIVPWQLLAEQTGATLKVTPLTPDNQLNMNAFDQLLSHNTKIVSICHASNSLGTINPVKEIIQKAKSVNAITVIDGAQAIAHLAIDVQSLDCDFYCFSGHKMFGPTGIGVLYGKQALLNSMPPWQCGGEMIQRVSFEGTTYNTLPFKFEAGTPNIAGAIGLGAAIKFIHQCDAKTRQQQEDALLAIAHSRAAQIPQLNIIQQCQPSVSLLAFNIDGYHASDIGTLLDQQGFAVRTGHHCTMPLMQHLGIDGSLRMSFAFYNTEDEVHRCFDCLQGILSGNISDIFSEEVSGKVSGKVSVLSAERLEQTNSLPNIQQLTDTLLSKKGWEDRYRFIMQLGKRLPGYPEEYRTDDHLVPGCDSTVWLCYKLRNQHGDNTLEFSIASNARIIKGLSVILLSYYNGKIATEINNSNIQETFEALGLSKHLSPSRNNGLLAINQRIIDIANEKMTGHDTLL